MGREHEGEIRWRGAKPVLNIVVVTTERTEMAAMFLPNSNEKREFFSLFPNSGRPVDADLSKFAFAPNNQ